MSARKILFAVVLGAILAVGALLLARPSPPEPLLDALLLPSQLALPDFSLLDQHGEAVDKASFEDQWHLLFFGFTHCPDICPATLQVLSAAKRQLREQGYAPLPRIVLVSVDPERDNPEKVKAYLAHFGPDHLGVTGAITEIRKLTGALGIYFSKQEGDTENYSVDHSAAVLLINKRGEFHALFGGPHRIENFVHDLPLILGET